jgi:hypothetical protein
MKRGRETRTPCGFGVRAYDASPSSGPARRGCAPSRPRGPVAFHRRRQNVARKRSTGLLGGSRLTFAEWGSFRGRDQGPPQELVDAGTGPEIELGEHVGEVTWRGARSAEVSPWRSSPASLGVSGRPRFSLAFGAFRAEWTSSRRPLGSRNNFFRTGLNALGWKPATVTGPD